MFRRLAVKYWLAVWRLSSEWRRQSTNSWLVVVSPQLIVVLRSTCATAVSGSDVTSADRVFSLHCCCRNVMVKCVVLCVKRCTRLRAASCYLSTRAHWLCFSGQWLIATRWVRHRFYEVLSLTVLVHWISFSSIYPKFTTPIWSSWHKTFILDRNRCTKTI